MSRNGYDVPSTETKQKLDRRIARWVQRGNQPCASDLDPYLAWDHDAHTQALVMRKKALPEYLCEADADAVARCRAWAYNLDMCLFAVGSARFGWDVVLSIIPLLPWAVAVVFRGCCGEVVDGLRVEDQVRMQNLLVKKFFYSIIPILGSVLAAVQGFYCSARMTDIMENRLMGRYADHDDVECAKMQLFVPMDLQLEKIQVGKTRKSQFGSAVKNKAWEGDAEEGRAGRFT